VISTAIDPSTSISLAAYPNPATDSWHFDTEALQGEHTLFTLHNTQGQIVMQESWDGLSGTESIAVPQPGMYFYSLVQEGRTIAKGKLIGK
jgi:hypothetical protein